MIGQVIGDFEIVRELGRGGMGTVLEARDRMLGRRVAIKVVRPELASDPVLAERFRKEAQALARLNHANVTSVYSLFRQDDQLFLVMELVDGESLEARLRQRGVLPWRQAAELAGAALDGLQHAHDNGIIHRDVKPANLFLPLAGGIKIMDFGIAHILGQGRLTQHGTAVGTLAYMSPEQITGGDLDPRTDLYSLGIVLYEMVTGRVPFRADSDFAIMRAHLEQAPEAPRTLAPNLPGWLEAAVVRALAKEPGQRYETAAALAADLRRGLEQTEKAETEPTRVMPAAAPLTPPPSTPPPRAAAIPAAPPTTVTPRRRFLPLALLGLVAVASAALVVTLPRSAPDAGPPPAESALGSAPAVSVPAPSPPRQEEAVVPAETPPPRTPPPPAVTTPPPPPPAVTTPPPPPPAVKPSSTPPPPVEPAPATAPPEPAAEPVDSVERLIELAEIADRLPPVSERLLDHYEDYRDVLEDEDEARVKPEDETLAERLDAFLDATELLRRSVNVVAEREGLARRHGLRRFATRVRSKLSSADRQTVRLRVDEVLEEGRRIRELLKRANSDEPTRTMWRQIEDDLARLERLKAPQ